MSENKTERRMIAIDTETTGLKAESGDRIVEIGAVEMIVVNGKAEKTGRTMQLYINPGRESDPEALKVHGLTTEFLKDKPKFNEVVDEFIKFINGAELVIHNAPFDIKFLNSELDMAGKGNLWGYVKNVTCTLDMDKRLFAEERRHSLDDICKRYGIDNQHRVLHGALLDSELLAECYIETLNRFPIEEIETDLEQTNWVRPAIKRFKGVNIEPIALSKNEEMENTALLQKMQAEEGVEPLFISQNKRKLSM